MKRPIPADSDDEAPEEVPRRRPRRAEPEAPRRRAPVPAEDEAEEEPEAGAAAEEAEEEEDDDDDDAFAALRDVPFAELQRLQGDGRGLVGRSAGAAAAAAAAAARRARLARANKNRPVEQSSKRPVQYVLPQLAGAPGVAPPRKAGRDPRFESLSGDLNDAAFRKRYAFVFEEKLPEERKRLKALLQREKKPARREELKEQLARVQQTLKRDADARTQDKRERERRQREKDAVKAGKKPFYVKKSVAKQEDLLQRYAELKASGQLEAFMAKRRAKLARKDHVHMPHQRRAQDDA